jgi:hypothetical protein
MHLLAAVALAGFKSRAALQLENLALRHQLGILPRSVKKPRLTSPDRLLWAWLSPTPLILHQSPNYLVTGNVKDFPHSLGPDQNCNGAAIL